MLPLRLAAAADLRDVGHDDPQRSANSVRTNPTIGTT